MASRPLGLVERFFITRQHIGFAPVLVFLATIDGEVEHVRNALVARLDAILARDAHLSSCVTGATTPKPAFKARDKRLRGQDVVALGDIGNIAIRNGKEDRLSQIMRFEMRTLARVDLEKDPLIRVAVYPDTLSKDNPSCHVVLDILHLIADGKGASNLFQALLSTSPLPSTFLKPGQLPAVQSSAMIKPPLWFVLPIAIKELVFPKLPKFLRRLLSQERAAWPTMRDLMTNPSQLNGELGTEVLLFPDQDSIPALKRAAVRTNVRTVNSLLHAVALAALYAAIGNDAPRKSATVLRSDTPISFRESEQQSHGLWSGNYIGMFENGYGIDAETPLWPLARSYATNLLKPETKRNGLYNMGMLEYVPSSPNKGVSPEWTSWETCFKSKLGSDSPFSCSFELSNPGALFTGVEDGSLEVLSGLRGLVWAQTPDALSTAILVQPIGLSLPDGKGSLSISIVWLKELLHEDCMAVFTRSLERIIRLLMCEENGAVCETATFDSIAALLAEEANA